MPWVSGACVDSWPLGVFPVSASGLCDDTCSISAQISAAAKSDAKDATEFAAAWLQSASRGSRLPTRRAWLRARYERLANAAAVQSHCPFVHGTNFKLYSPTAFCARSCSTSCRRSWFLGTTTGSIAVQLLRLACCMSIGDTSTFFLWERRETSLQHALICSRATPVPKPWSGGSPQGWPLQSGQASRW